MATRIDWLDDPNAPAATNIVPAANAVVVDNQGRILLIQREDNGNWALPGGGLDIGESLPSAAIREVQEETGVEVEITGLVGIYTDPNHRIEYTSNGEVRQEFAVVFTARPIRGEPTPTDEATQARWVELSEVNKLEMHPRMRLRIDHFAQSDDSPHLG